MQSVSVLDFTKEEETFDDINSMVFFRSKEPSRRKMIDKPIITRLTKKYQDFNPGLYYLSSDVNL